MTRLASLVKARARSLTTIDLCMCYASNNSISSGLLTTGCGGVVLVTATSYNKT